MEPNLDKEEFFRPSYIASAEPLQRTGPVSVEDLKTDLSGDFSLVSSDSDTSQRNVLEPKGHIQVCLRIRPFTSLERENELQSCVSIEDSTSVILKPPQYSLSRLSEKTVGQKFTFSQVFAPETTQEEFFEGTMKKPVQDFLDGYNRLIFTYGVTNAGKTYTFQGTEDDIGILPRTMDMLFKSIQGRLYTAMDFKPHRCRDYIRLTRDQVKEETAIKNSILRLTKEVDHQDSTNSKAPVGCKDLEELLKGSEQSSTTAKNHVKFSLWVSFCEIYNECFYDLLIPMSNDKKRKTLRLAQDVKGCSYVKGLQWVQISDSKEAFRLLKLGLKHQSIASTKLNTFSSRSHSIFTVKILKIEDSGAPQVTRVNELSLCDLAGSERYAKTHSEGHRLKESGNINTSLLILGKCINALKNSQQSKSQQHIPFRESKLTHFLQGFFSGKGSVYMIVNISQCASTYDETLHVLKFSAIAQKVLAMDTSVFVQDQSFDQKSTTSSLLSHIKMPISRKRVTVLWDRSLEDVIEDDNEMEEQHMSGEEAVQKHEDNKVIMGKKEYMMLLNLIEELKNKLIAEKKNKLLLELKIREEVMQEFAQYFAEQEIYFNEFLSYERERLQEDSDRRLEIFKELVNGDLEDMDEENELKDKPCSEQAGPLDGEHGIGPGTYKVGRKRCSENLCAKEKIIEDMRMTLEEQEQTHIKQDQVIETKLEETNRLVWELEAWKQRYRELDNQSNSDWQQKMSKTTEKNIDENEELIKLRKELKESETKYQTDKKNWLEEKMRLMSEVKEAESHHNREMRKFADDRERYVEQQAEIERLAAQLVEKDNNLQKWREERNKLIEALEVQLKTLASITIQKDKEIAELKQAAVNDSGKDEGTDTEELRKQLAEKDDFIKELKQGVTHKSLQSLAEVPLPEGQDKIDQSVNKEEHSEIVLDSSEVSTESGNTSRFPKPEMEIQFTPLEPDKMEVKHQGSTLPATVKVLKPRKKRTSEERDEMSSTQKKRKEYPLRKQESTSRKKSAKKKDGTLQKIGDFFQSSPVIFHSKAKKLMATISSPKSAEPENVKGKELKPKRSKRKLCSTDSSCPLDIPDSSVFIEKKRRKAIS
ncbi:kinesin-like protein KIF20B [Strix uralensis]|uniref:kinesin-like protein KIF20B n=2 Tax=Strix uralensis TaxID=36305 RepID=UPI003DA41BB4